MRFFKLTMFLIFTLLIAACSAFIPETEYIIVTATPEISTATPFPTRTPIPSPTSTPIPTILVVMAIQDIPAGIQIQAHMVAERELPAEFVQTSSFWSVDDVIGAYVANDIVREEIILYRKLVFDDSGYLASNLIMTVFTSRDIAADEAFERDMYYFAYIEQSTLVELGINSDGIFNAWTGFSTQDWVATRDIHAYEPILKSMIGQ